MDLKDYFIVGFMIAIAGVAFAAREPHNPRGTCMPATGEGTTLSVSSSSAVQLDPDFDYEVHCTVDVYYEFHTATLTADSNSMPHASGTWYFGTKRDQAPFVAFVDQAASSGTCELRKCL